MWYKGASFNLATPFQNNALKSTHYVVKNQHTLIQRLVLIPYFANAFKMIKIISLDRVNVKPFQSDVNISNEVIVYSFIICYLKNKFRAAFDSVYIRQEP